jgi:hypothetical protein
MVVQIVGTDLAAGGSGVRRSYDLPILPSMEDLAELSTDRSMV